MIEAQAIDRSAIQQFIANNRQSFHQVLAFLDLSEGFTLGIVEIDVDGQIAGLVNAIEQHPDCQSMQFCLFNLDDPGLTFLRDEMVQRLSQVKKPVDKKLVILITGLENAIGNSLADDYPPFLQDLNYVRDILPRDIPYPILFFLPGYAVTRLGKFAPDVWAWISGIFTFTENYEQRHSLLQELRLPDLIFIDSKDSDINLEAEKKRLATLRERLEIYDQSGDDSPQELLYLFSEIGFALVGLEELTKAEVFLEKAQQLIQTEDSLKNQLTQAEIDSQLGIIFTSRTDGNRAENIEKAISYYQSALNIYTIDSFPEKWAMTQNNLGNAYRNRIKGDKADNLETAIAYYLSALTVYTPDAFPENFAVTQKNLGLAYYFRIKGSKAENLETAIAYFQNGLTIITKEDTFLQQWVETQYNLGGVYFERIKGEKVDNLETAITYFQNPLTIITKDAFPNVWAMTQIILGMVYSTRIKGEKADNLETAIACYQNALTIITPDAFPEQWAMTQNNLAIAYRNRIKGDKAENLETAIICCQNALTVYTKDTFPEDWAMTQNNLAIAYKNRIVGDQEININEAIKLLRSALTVRTTHQLPQDCLQSAKNLGDIGFETEQWKIAQEGYKLAIQAIEQICEWSPPDDHQRIREEAKDIYEKLNIVSQHLENIRSFS
jgi:tetratricopeptide (TPR) repeat protein